MFNTQIEYKLQTEQMLISTHYDNEINSSLSLTKLRYRTMQILNTSSSQVNTFSQKNFSLSRSFPTETINIARKISLRKTKHAFLMLICKMIEQASKGKCHARMVSLAVMLSETIGKALKRTAMKDLSSWFEASGMGVRIRKHKRAAYEYVPSDICWAYYYIHRHRIPKKEPDIPKTDPQIFENRPSISKSLISEKDLTYIPPRSKIYRGSQVTSKGGDCLKQLLEEKLREVPYQLRPEIRRQVNEYKKKIVSNEAFLNTVIGRVVDDDLRQRKGNTKSQQYYREIAEQKIETLKRLQEEKTQYTALTSNLIAECKRRLKEGINDIDLRMKDNYL